VNWLRTPTVRLNPDLALPHQSIDAVRRLVRIIVVIKAYGLYLNALRSTHQAPYRISGSELWSDATGSSRMAASRYGSAGESLAWRPDHVGHGAFMGTTQGVAPGLCSGNFKLKGLQRARLQ
jgi:hypothetical protein